MFYSHDILQKRGGKFGIVWGAATQAISITRREFYRVNVTQTCDDIVRYLTLQATPYRSGGPRPRLSLYLSSQLMYGTVKIFDNQCRYLLSDASALLLRCQVMRGLVEQQIDLPPMPRSVKHITMEDCLEVMTDPTFPDNQLTSPNIVRLEDIPDVEMWMSPVFGDMQSPLRGVPRTPHHHPKPDIPLPASPQAVQVPFRAELGSPLQVQKPEDITLREGHSLDQLQMEFMMLEQELPPLVAPPDFPVTAPLIPPTDQEAGIPQPQQQTSEEEDPLSTRRRHQEPSVLVDDLVGQLRETGGTTLGETEAEKSPSRQLPSDDLPTGNVVGDVIRQLREIAADQTVTTETDVAVQLAPGEELLWRDPETQAAAIPIATDETVLAAAPDATVSTDGAVTAGEQSAGEKSGDPIPPLTELQEIAALAPTEETPAVLPDPDAMQTRPKRRPVPTPGVTPGSPLKEKEKKRKARRRMDVSLELQPAPPSPAYRRRRGHLIVDKETQIAKKKIRANFTSGASLCNRNFLPEPRIPTVENLFKTPASGLKHPRLVAHWKKNAFTVQERTQIDDDKPYWTVPITSESSGSERDSPLARPILDMSSRLSPIRERQEDQLPLPQEIPADPAIVPDNQVLDVSGILRDHEVSAQEQAREASRMSDLPGDLSASFAPDSSLQLSRVSRLSHDITPDVSLQRSIRSSSRRQGQASFEEEQLDMTLMDRRSLAAVQELPEDSQLHEKTPLEQEQPGPSSLLIEPLAEPQQLQFDLQPSPSSAQEQEFIETFKEMSATRKEIRFVDICPYTTPRDTVASLFTQLLGLCAQQKLKVFQEEPYGNIHIRRGSNM